MFSFIPKTIITLISVTIWTNAFPEWNGTVTAAIAERRQELENEREPEERSV